jgi:hypothetical protein
MQPQPTTGLIGLARAELPGLTRGDVLPLAVAVDQFARSFNEAASRYGLDKCGFG